MSTFMRCEPCGKNFTGRVCYNQHVESEKHKRKVLSLSLLNSTNAEYVQPASTISQTPQSNNVFDCSVCNVAFNSLTNFQIHSLSASHAQKVIEKTSENDQTSTIVSSTNSSLNFEDDSADGNISIDETDKILPAIGMCKSQTLSFSTCNICNKTFSGPEPYKQHMESVAHKKKVALATDTLDTKTNQIFMAFACDPCKKTFSGQIPYVQHMNSEIHKKKMLNLQYLEKSFEVDSPSGTEVPNGEENNLKEKNQNIPWFCYVCEKQCSGFIPYKQHLEGITHMKNMAKAQREKCSSKPEDSTQLVQYSNEGKYILNGSYLINGTNMPLNKGNQNLQVDFILPEVVSNLHEVSTEELEESINIFLPDEEIDFDKFDNKANTDSGNVSIEIQGEANEKFRNDQGYKENNICDNLEGMQVDEIKGKSDVSEMCNLCNVKLLNIEEARNHYESLEHFTRKWRSN